MAEKWVITSNESVSGMRCGVEVNSRNVEKSIDLDRAVFFDKDGKRKTYVSERTCKPKHWSNASGVAFARGECSECGGYLLENSETGNPRPYCPHCGAKVVL